MSVCDASPLEKYSLEIEDLVSNGFYEEAIPICLKLVYSVRKASFGYFKLAVCLIHVGDSSGAKESLRKCIQSDPNHFESRDLYHQLVAVDITLALDEGNYFEALRMAKELIDADQKAKSRNEAGALADSLRKEIYILGGIAALHTQVEVGGPLDEMVDFQTLPVVSPPAFALAKLLFDGVLILDPQSVEAVTAVACLQTLSLTSEASFIRNDTAAAVIAIHDKVLKQEELATSAGGMESIAKKIKGYFCEEVRPEIKGQSSSFSLNSSFKNRNIFSLTYQDMNDERNESHFAQLHSPSPKYLNKQPSRASFSIPPLKHSFVLQPIADSQSNRKDGKRGLLPKEIYQSLEAPNQLTSVFEQDDTKKTCPSVKDLIMKAKNDFIAKQKEQFASPEDSPKHKTSTEDDIRKVLSTNLSSTDPKKKKTVAGGGLKALYSSKLPQSKAILTSAESAKLIETQTSKQHPKLSPTPSAASLRHNQESLSIQTMSPLATALFWKAFTLDPYCKPAIVYLMKLHSSVRNLISIGEHMILEGHFEMAIDALTMALKTSPDIPRILYLRAIALRKLKRYHEALTDLRMLVVNQEPSLERLAGRQAGLCCAAMSRDLLMEGRWAEGEALASEAISFCPDEPVFFELRGDCRMLFKPANATEDFEKAAGLLDMDLKPIKLHHGVNASEKVEDSTWDRVATMFEDSQITTGAKILKAVQTLERLRIKITKSRQAVGKTLLKQGSSVDAILELTRALQSSVTQQTADVLILRSKAKDQIGDHAGAVVDVSKAVAVDICHRDAWSALTVRGPVARSSQPHYNEKLVDLKSFSATNSSPYSYKSNPDSDVKQNFRFSSSRAVVCRGSRQGQEGATIQELEDILMATNKDNHPLSSSNFSKAGVLTALGEERLEIVSVISRSMQNSTNPRNMTELGASPAKKVKKTKGEDLSYFCSKSVGSFAEKSSPWKITSTFMEHRKT